MKNILTLISIIITLCGFGQSIDSTTYYLYSNDPNIDSITYKKQFYSNGQLKEKGWVLFCSKDNNYITFDSMTNFDCFSNVEFKVGEYMYYHKNGSIECILKNPIEVSDTTYMFVYNSKNELVSEEKFIESSIIKLRCRNLKSKWYTLKDYKYYQFKHFSKGKLTSEGYYNHRYLKTDCWKTYNKKGEVVKERLYKNDKLLKKSCS